jgi:branched-chain amino acid transport system permease protein
MDIFFQLLVSGFATGGVYALIALGFVLIYKATHIINFATGEFMMIGAYLCYTFLALAGIPVMVTFLLVMACAAALGFLVERLILRHMLGQPIISVIMVTIGLSSILVGLAEIIWTSQFQNFPPLFPRAPLNFGFVVVRSTLAYGFAISMAAVAIFALIFKYAKAGVAMRATAGDQMAAFSMGINVKTMFTLAWALGAIAAALGGVIVGNIGGISPVLGAVGLKIFPVVILGGLDSILGAVVGGLIIGVLENLAGGYLDPYFGGGVKEVAPFVIMVIILLIKPYGLFGKQDIERL